MRNRTVSFDIFYGRGSGEGENSDRWYMGYNVIVVVRTVVKEVGGTTKYKGSETCATREPDLI